MRYMPKTIHRYISADDADFLQGTDLENAPGPGIYDVRIASTQADTSYNVSTNGAAGTVVRGQDALLRANGEVRQYDPAIRVPVAGGEKVIIDVNIETSATVGIYVHYRPAA